MGPGGVADSWRHGTGDEGCDVHLAVGVGAQMVEHGARRTDRQPAGFEGVERGEQVALRESVGEVVFARLLLRAGGVEALDLAGGSRQGDEQLR